MTDQQFALFFEADTPKKKSKTKKEDQRGCEHCTLNKDGISKIFGSIDGKEIAIFAQSPGPDENEEERELVGRAGQWLWDELARVGVERDDCDINNVVRCFPADIDEGTYRTRFKMRNPTAHEIKCCSIYTEQAVEKLKAKQILVLGQIAAKALLKTRSLPQNKIFWDARLNAKIYLLDHPAYFIRGYASADRLKTFREILDVFAIDRAKESGVLSDQYVYLRKQDYRLVLNKAQAVKARQEIWQYAKQGFRVSTDIEYAKFDDGVVRVICCGFSPKPGLSYVFIFNHKDQSAQDGLDVQRHGRAILQNPKYKKTFHHGCSDIVQLQDLMGVTVGGYDHDTNLSEYLRFPEIKQYGLAAIAERRFPEFSGYKGIVSDDIIKKISTDD